MKKDGGKRDEVDDSQNRDAGNKSTWLGQEADHFFQAEMYHDQRASWLIALATGLLTLVLGSLVAISDGKLKPAGRTWLILSLIFLGAAVLLGLISLWPRAGREGTFWIPFRFTRRHRAYRQQRGYSEGSEEAHVRAHQLRAAKKADWIVLLISSLFLGVLFALAGSYLAVP